MAVKDLVRERIVDTMRDLLRSNSISKISVGQIADAAGVSRMTIYRYFKDKYDIQKEILDGDSKEGLAQFEQDHDVVKLIQSSATVILKNRDVYRNLFSNQEEQNSFFEQWLDNTRNMIISLIGPENITDEIRVAIYFLLYGGFYVSWDSVKGHIDLEPDVLAKTIVKCWPESIKKLLEITD